MKGYKMLIAAAVALSISTCSLSPGGKSSDVILTDNEQSEAIINFDMIKAEDVPVYSSGGEDSVFMEMVLDYNKNHDKAKFDSLNGKEIKTDLELLKKVLVLSYNL